MNLEKQLSVLTGSILALTIAVGSIGCLQSAFDITISNPAALWGIVAGVAVLYALALQWKHGSLAVTCLLALAGGYLYRDGTAMEQLWQMLYRISTVYDRAYHWGVLRLVDTSWDAGAADLPLGIWGTIVALSTVRSVCRQKRVVLPVLTALAPLFACVVVTDTVPREGYLLVLLAGLILLILTSSVRRESQLQGIRLTAASALPVVLALLGLFLAIPQERYVNRSKILQENIITALEHMPQLMENGLTGVAADIQGKPARQVNLAQLGDRIPFTYPVMEVTAEKEGTVYLRGQDYDGYDGHGWTATESREEIFSRQEAPEQTITIHTRGGKQLRYLPYYPGEEAILVGGAAENPKRITDYTIPCASLPEDWRQTAYLSEEAGDPDLQPYLSLPEHTRQEAQKKLAGLWDSSAGNTEKADIIAALVTDAADYSLSPAKMPAGEPDFALWFLESSGSGYCIHFATSAAVLLRAADVPARYVTGYMFDAIPGQTITVTEENAHAWAEYYEPSLSCWIPLEATPAGEAEVVIATTPPVQTQATEATTIPTEPEVPETTADIIPLTVPVIPEAPPQPVETDNQELLLLLLIPVFALALAVQRSVRLELRRRRQRKGSPNQQALQRWREAERLARLLKETPAEELIDLAQKAKYSQHELTAEELQHFDSYCRSCLRRLKDKPIWLRLIYQYIYAVY